MALAVALVIAGGGPARAQGGETDGTASLREADWMAGRWIGTGMGGEVEEIWSPAAGGQMIGHFRYSRNGQPGFYEIMMIDRTDKGLRMRVKHFNPDFTAWEDKAEWVEFDPVSATDGRLSFDGLTIDRIGDGAGKTMVATLRLRQKDGAVKSVVFTLVRAD